MLKINKCYSTFQSAITGQGSLPTVCSSKLVNGFEVHFVQVHLLESIQHFLLVCWVRDPNLKMKKAIAAKTEVRLIKNRFIDCIIPRL